AARGESGRPRIEDRLCWYWRVELGRAVASSVDPLTGEEGGPMVRFLIAASAPTELRPNGALTPSAARGAIRKFKAQMRQEGDPWVSPEQRALDLAEGRRVLESLCAEPGDNGEPPK